MGHRRRAEGRRRRSQIRAEWLDAATHFDASQLLDVLLLAGWYHAVSFVANAAHVPLEASTPRFADVAEQLSRNRLTTNDSGSPRR